MAVPLPPPAGVEYQSLISLGEFYCDCIFFDGLAICLTLLYTARKYISDRRYNGTVMSTLFFTQYCHVHFYGWGVVVLKLHIIHLETLYTRLKSFFKADLSTNTTHLHDGVTLLLRPESFSYFPFMFLFLILVIPARLKALLRILVAAVK